ncbi:uncharacterized protein LOC117639453 [Thrips palmi]|uniref:Uncharacterized protein LOC117639453 n=1 Tax=Thrips palmi TaxID=161013 RepID=A0A6P8Y3T3_THRPL|nr:uncharacterized protein LOC117639453 [Thrips palmi]
MFDGRSSFDVEQPYQPVPLVNNPASTWLHTPPMQMPWGIPTSDQPSVMRFTGDTSITPIVPTAPAPVPDIKSTQFQSLSKTQSKRKSWDCEIEYNCPPPKQLITEEKMAENLNCLHISNSYVSHQIGSNQPMSIQLPKSTSTTSTEVLDMSSSSSSSSSVETALDGKDRTVSLCEQLRKLISESSVIPSPLLNKVERPTNALVLWKPPGETIFKSIGKTSPNEDLENQLKQQQDEEAKASTSGIGFSSRPSSQTSWSDLMDNNNSNSAMDLNLLSPGSSSYQLLPSEVPLPDDDAMDLPDDSSMDY